ncbi:hypothetical protein [Flavobacterium sp.]|uniref:hypothetical protein n=1 Tax=Flavobacterium sp. TaxID=239 RepID=UPI003D6C1BFF
MKNNTIRKLLGFTQEEISIVLSITRSQWSMYEIGQRDLPLAAKKELTAILLYLQKTKEISKVKKEFLALEQTKIEEWLLKELRNIEYKKQLLSKKIDAMENKRVECFAALDTIYFLEEQNLDANTSLLQHIKRKALDTLNNNSLYKLESIQM